jgi:hypothetical protein
LVGHMEEDKRRGEVVAEDWQRIMAENNSRE